MASGGIKDARVELRDLQNGTPVTSTYTLPNGTFELYNIPLGEYEIVATSGLDQVTERVSVRGSAGMLELRMPGRNDEHGGSATMSVAEYKVPDKARNEFKKAQELLKKSQLQQAREHLDKALQIYPKYAAALTLRGILAVDQQNDDEALNYLQQAIQSDPQYGMAYVAMGAYFNRHDKFDEAIRSLDRGISMSPATWQGYFEMSKSLLAKGMFGKALDQVNRASALEPGYAPIHLLKAHVLLGLKNYTNAVAELEQYLSSEPSGPNTAKARQTLDQVKSFVASGVVAHK